MTAFDAIVHDPECEDRNRSERVDGVWYCSGCGGGADADPSVFHGFSAGAVDALLAAAKGRA